MVIPNIVTKFLNYDIFEHFEHVVCSRLPRGKSQEGGHGDEMKLVARSAKKKMDNAIKP